MSNEKNPVPFPKRARGLNRSVGIRLPEPMQGSARLFLRELSKQSLAEYYFLSIETGISGRTDSGEIISIDVLGRWIFGVPGYMGHLTASNWDDSHPLMCEVSLPSDSPQLAWDFVEALRVTVEALPVKPKHRRS